MWLITGLGNPGDEYINTRHNIGFQVLESFSDDFKIHKKTNSLISKIDINGNKALLCLPQTFMNNSGDAVLKAKQFFKISNNKIIIVADDIDLPFGTIRISNNSSSGGHKGIQSIINRLKTKEIIRIRIGIAGTQRQQTETSAYVLKKFSSTEQKNIKKIVLLSKEAIETILNNGITKAQNIFNTK